MTNNISVWAVHVLTASGAAIALVAAVAAGHGAWQVVFLCLGIAMIVDGIDGPIARKLDVTGRLPGSTGRRSTWWSTTRPTYSSRLWCWR